MGSWLQGQLCPGLRASAPVGVLLCCLLAACSGQDEREAGPGDNDAGTGSDKADAMPPNDAGGDSDDAGGDSDDAGGDPPRTAPDDAWTHMGYDHRNWYFNPHEKAIGVDNASSLVEKWRFTVMGFPAGSPLIVDGRVFVMATGGTYAIDLETGAMVWERRDIIGTASLAYADGFIYAHEITGPDLYKLNALDGTTVWGPVTTYAFDGCDGMSSPVVVEGKVIVGHCCGNVELGPDGGGGEARGGVEAFSASSGEPIWTYWTADPGEDGAMVWSTVGVDVAGETVYATSGNNYTLAGPNSDAFHAIDLETGMRKWVYQVRSGDVWALMVSVPGPDGDVAVNPIVMDEMIAAGDKMSAFWGISKSGERLWGREELTESRSPSNGGILNAGAFDGQRLYTLANDPEASSSMLFALDPETGENAWEPKRYQTLVWGGVSTANGVLFAAVNNELAVLDAATGAELKAFDTGGSIAGGSPAVAEGMVVVGSGLQYPFGGTFAINNNQVIAYGLP